MKKSTFEVFLLKGIYKQKNWQEKSEKENVVMFHNEFKKEGTYEG